MAATARDITFIISGQAQPMGAGAATTRGHGGATVKASVRVGAQRDGGDVVRVTARPGEEVVVLTIANGPTLVLHPCCGRRAAGPRMVQRLPEVRSRRAPTTK